MAGSLMLAAAAFSSAIVVPTAIAGADGLPNTVSFTSTNPSPVNVGATPYTPIATGLSSSPVVISLDTSSAGCDLNEGVVTFTSVGTCVIDANQAGDANYDAAPQVQQFITVDPALCAAGTYSANGEVPCDLAPAGTYVPNSGATWPTNCQAGSFSSSTGSTSCILAPAGQYVAYVGSTAPSNCPAGSFSAAAGSTGCTLAPAGSYVSASGSSSATTCSAGSYSAAPGASSCTPAPINTYVATTGAVAATACPSGTFTASTGSTSLSSCVVVAVTNPGGQSDYVFAPITALVSTQSNGIPTVTWSANGLPAGLSISAGGTITGTPATPCTCSVTLVATDASGHTGTTTFSWSILPFSITSASLPDATPGTGFGPVTLQVAGVGVSVAPSVTTLKWLGAELPKGMKLSSAGVLSGTPSAKLPAGTYQVVVTVTETVHSLNGSKKVKTPTTIEATLSLTIA